MPSIATSELRRMLQQVEPHMADDVTLPVLNAVHLEAHRGYLFAVASDRYTLAVARNALLGADETWRAMVPAADLPTVLAWLKASDETVEITVADLLPATELTTELTLTGKGSAVKLTAELGTGFPQWRTIIHSTLVTPLQPVEVSTWTTKYFARWKHADKVLHAMWSGPKSPMVLTDREGSFIGMQMPVNEGDAAPTHEAITSKWLGALAPIAYVGNERYSLDTQWSDKDDDVWEYTGRNRYGQPLMRLVGIDDDDHTLADLIKHYGPISCAAQVAVTPQGH
jgi:hypothetical protein